MQLLTGQTHTLNSITTLTTPATSYNTTVIFRPWKSMHSLEWSSFSSETSFLWWVYLSHSFLLQTFWIWNTRGQTEGQDQTAGTQQLIHKWMFFFPVSAIIFISKLAARLEVRQCRLVGGPLWKISRQLLDRLPWNLVQAPRTSRKLSKNLKSYLNIF